MSSSVVTVGQGRLRGTSRDGVQAFLGVPFAAPPVGARRWAPPVPPASWDGERDATALGAIVPQPPSLIPAFTPALPGGDDCLNLNVWTPDPSTGAGLPVMVWIHGGAFINGAGSEPLYDGTHFARAGVVLVTVNYRMGADGYLLSGDAAGAGNFGLLDQIAALQWVQQEIGAFGGDAGNVTAFGESAGGISVGSLLAAPAAKGLFRRAIPQSGSVRGTVTAEHAETTTAAFYERLGVRHSDIDALRALSTEVILKAQSELGVEAMMRPPTSDAPVPMSWAPTSGTPALPAPPEAAVRAGAARDVDILIGSTADEGMLFTGLLPQLFDDARVTAMAGAAFGAGADRVLSLYRTNRPGAASNVVAGALMTDWTFRIPAVRVAEAQAAAGNPAHAYLFSWRTPVFGGVLGSCHALELPFVFGTLDSEAGRFLAGDQPPAALSEELRSTWVRFATDGTCDWPAYTPEHRAVRDFGTTGEVLVDPQPDERVAWD